MVWWWAGIPTWLFPSLWTLENPESTSESKQLPLMWLSWEQSKQKLWRILAFIHCFNLHFDAFFRVGKNWKKLKKIAKGLVKGSFWGGLVMGLNSNLTKIFQVHGVQSVQKVHQSPNNCLSCSSSGILKTKSLKDISFLHTTLICIWMSMTEFLGHTAQIKCEKLRCQNLAKI